MLTPPPDSKITTTDKNLDKLGIPMDMLKQMNESTMEQTKLDELRKKCLYKLKYSIKRKQTMICFSFTYRINVIKTPR